MYRETGYTINTVQRWPVSEIHSRSVCTLFVELCYLRNRKHVLCFYRVIETQVKVWENEKCCGNGSRRQVFPHLFRVLPYFHECFYDSIETRKACFLFLLENSATQKRKSTCYLWSSKYKFSFLPPSLCQQLVLVLCFYRVLYNNPSHSRILIESCLWSIRGQTHDWRHYYKVFPSAF